MLKQYGTLAKTASLSFLMLSLGIQSVEGFTIISFDGKPARWDSNNTVQVEYDPNFGNEFNSSGCDSYGRCVAPSGIGTLGKAITSSVKTWENVERLNLNAKYRKRKIISSEHIRQWSFRIEISH